MEIAFPDFQSLLLALRYSGGMGMSMRRRTPVNNELNPDNMTYEVLFLFLIFKFILRNYRS